MSQLKKIYWERVNLHFLFDKKITQSIYLTNNSKKIYLEKSTDKDFFINITNVNGTMLDADSWYLKINDENPFIEKEIYNLTNDLSRNFKYRGNLYAYLVNFLITNTAELKIVTQFMMINYKPQKFFRLNETKKIRRKLKIIMNIIAVYCANVLYAFLRMFKFNKKNILFLTENSNELTGNLKSLFEYTKNNRNENVEIFCNDKYKNKRKLLTFLKELFFIARADYIFVDNYTPVLTHVRLGKNVRLIQLWHAGVGFKAVGYARFGLDGSPHPYKSCHRYYTNVIVDHKDLIKIYQEVFGIRKDVFFSVGMPRLNNYLNINKIKNVTEMLYRINQKFKTSKVILFSPTYRGTGSKTAYYNYDLIDFEEIYKFCKKKNYIFVIKNHPFIDEKVNVLTKYKDFIYDYSTLDINDLIYVTDIMITDYSSCAYEYSLFDRPLIFYRYDKEFYEYDRPLHTVDKFTAKQYEVKTFKELMDVLKSIKTEDRFKNIVKRNKKDSCRKILSKIVGD